MSLSDRLNAARGIAPAPPPADAPAPVPAETTPAAEQPLAAPSPAATPLAADLSPASMPRAERVPDALSELKERAAQELFVRIGSRLNDSSMTEAQLHVLAREELGRIVEAEKLALSAGERSRLISEIGADVLGFGPLESLLDDDAITEIMVNRYDQIYVERDGKLHELAAQFSGEAQLRRVIERIVARVGRRIDESSPLVDARLDDGSRVNAIIPPLAVKRRAAG